jgi:hypothetical protein
MARVTIPKWLKKGAVVRVFDDCVVTCVSDNGWIWIRSKGNGSSIAVHVSQLGKKMERKRAEKKVVK